MDQRPAADVESWGGVTTSPNETEAALVVGFLESRGIPARVVDGSCHDSPTSGGDLTRFEIAVPAERLEEAQQSLDARGDEMPAGAGDETVLTDDGPAEISSDPETPDPSR